MPITSPLLRAVLVGAPRDDKRAPRSPAASAGSDGKRVKRDAFLFMLPKPPVEEFGQCGSCGAFIAAKQRCYWHRRGDVIDEDDSCGLYAHGRAMANAEPTAAVTPEISGLYDGEVRCKHCRFSEKRATRCGLYAELNQSLPEIFALDTNIDPHACCNAFEPLPGKGTKDDGDAGDDAGGDDAGGDDGDGDKGGAR